MRTIIILQDPKILWILRDYLLAQRHALLILNHKLKAGNSLPKNVKVLFKRDLTNKDLFNKLALCPEDRVMLHFSDLKDLKKAITSILVACEHLSMLVMVNNENEAAKLDSPANVAYMPIEKLLTAKISSHWQQIDNRKKITKILQLTKGADNLLILTQHDPDPDALASGLALRSLLGRNKTTAPIGSFGEVIRSENRTMMQLLDIQIMKIDFEKLQNFDRIAMLDVQPAYFAEHAINADIIIDHHPQMEKYEASFTDIRVHYGATSTILSEYLFAEGNKITQRLATALLYGIKTDTLFLGRDITPSDIDAFTHIYPLANHHMIRQMEHPSLNPEEISSYIKALKFKKIINNVLFVHLGNVVSEDIIPRLADFCLQIAGAEWSVISGIFEKKVVISVRNIGYVKHAGEIIRQAFENFGSAGGHRSMAKAVIPLQEFKKYTKTTGKEEIEKTIITFLLQALEA